MLNDYWSTPESIEKEKLSFVKDMTEEERDGFDIFKIERQIYMEGWDDRNLPTVAGGIAEWKLLAVSS